MVRLKINNTVRLETANPNSLEMPFLFEKFDWYDDLRTKLAISNSNASVQTDYGAQTLSNLSFRNNLSLQAPSIKSCNGLWSIPPVVSR
jgi:hypothetical protein